MPTFLPWRMRVIVPKDQLILDVGANIGTFTLHLSKRCPGCTIIALEPGLVTYLLLQLNVAHLTNVVTLNWFWEKLGYSGFHRYSSTFSRVAWFHKLLFRVIRRYSSDVHGRSLIAKDVNYRLILEN